MTSLAPIYQDQDEYLRPIADEILKGTRLGENGERFQAETIRICSNCGSGSAAFPTAQADCEVRRSGVEVARVDPDARDDLAQVKDLEKRLLGDEAEKPSGTGDSNGLWAECQQDRDLKKLFSMRPHFDELTLEEVERYLKVSQIATNTPESVIGQPLAPLPVAPLVLPEYKPLVIAITNTGQEGHYRVSLWEPLSDPKQETKATSEVQIDWAAIDRQITTLGRFRQTCSLAVTRDLFGPLPKSNRPSRRSNPGKSFF